MPNDVKGLRHAYSPVFRCLHRARRARAAGLAPAALAFPVIDAGSGLQPLGFMQSSAENAAANDSYGSSVAYSGGVMVVGAPTREMWSGAAYITTHSGELVLQQTLTAEGVATMNMFGVSVDVSGDTVVVSAPGRTVGANEGQGAVFVYGPSGGSWVLQATVTAGDGATGDFFGTAVALQGDTLVVGTGERDLDGAENAGTVYVFTRSGGVWTQSAELTAPHPEKDAWFGGAVSLDGDTLGVGAAGENGYDGAAYVFTGSGASWSQQARMTTPGATDGEFGGTVAVDGDTLLVGSAFKGSNGAFVFTRTGSVWDAGAEAPTAPGVAVKDGFGSSVAVSGDVAVVGAAEQQVGGVDNVGAVYTFTRQSGVWGSPTRTATPNAGDDGLFGGAVDLEDNSLAVGAPGESLAGLPFCGDAYLGVPTVGPTIQKAGGGPGWHRQPVTLTFSATPSTWARRSPRRSTGWSGQPPVDRRPITASDSPGRDTSGLPRRGSQRHAGSGGYDRGPHRLGAAAHAGERHFDLERPPHAAGLLDQRLRPGVRARPAAAEDPGRARPARAPRVVAAGDHQRPPHHPRAHRQPRARHVPRRVSAVDSAGNSQKGVTVTTLRVR